MLKECIIDEILFLTQAVTFTSQIEFISTMLALYSRKFIIAYNHHNNFLVNNAVS
jgi:hypothetical protein